MSGSGEGSYGIGFLLGIVFGLIGVLVAWILGASETKRGAWHGFFTTLILAGVVIVGIIVLGVIGGAGSYA